MIFVLIDHCLGILKDLAADRSEFRPYLNAAWSQNTEGTAHAFAPGLVQNCLRRIVEDLPWQSFRDRLWKLGKERYPNDYTGDVVFQDKADAEERWKWFQTTFLVEASKRVEENRAGLAWMAVDACLAASFPDHKPVARRDLDASPYTLPFNRTVCALNRRLLDKLVEVAARKPQLG